jgi:hypothetical protein
MAPALATLAEGMVKEKTGMQVVGGEIYDRATGRFITPPKEEKPRVRVGETDLTDKVIVFYSDGTTETFPKGAAPRAAGGGGGGAPRAAGGGGGGAASPPDLSKSAQDRIIQIRERMASSQEGVAGLTEARQLSDLAFEGPGANLRAAAAAAAPDRMVLEGARETIEFDLLLKQQVLPQLKSIFGAAPTEGERKILLELQGSSSLPKSVRNKVLDRAIAAAQRRMAMDQQEEAAILSGSYFTKPMSPPEAPAASGAPVAPAAAPAAPAASQYIYRNGRLVPAQPR